MRHELWLIAWVATYWRLVAEPGVVTLRVTDRSSLDLYDSAEHYESYQIMIGDRLIVV
jgi:hypothetical protein